MEHGQSADALLTFDCTSTKKERGGRRQLQRQHKKGSGARSVRVSVPKRSEAKSDEESTLCLSEVLISPKPEKQSITQSKTF